MIRIIIDRNDDRYQVISAEKDLLSDLRENNWLRYDDKDYLLNFEFTSPSSSASSMEKMMSIPNSCFFVVSVRIDTSYDEKAENTLSDFFIRIVESKSHNNYLFVFKDENSKIYRELMKSDQAELVREV